MTAVLQRRKSPRELGFRMPAEWERHQATWFSWPHNLETWPEELQTVEATIAGAVAALVESEEVFINVLDANHQRHVERLLADVGADRNVRYFPIPTNDAWARDHGAIFLTRTDRGRTELAASTWRFNSWGGKYPPWDLDDAAANAMADALGVPVFEHDVVLEGGSIDVNGSGTALSTEACLLHPNRNPHLSTDQLERMLMEAFGLHQIIWLGDGIAGDDTDGHIDDLTRFVAPDTVVTVVEKDTYDVNYRPLQENLRRLEYARLHDGRPINVIPLPCPRPQILKGDRMPASYANFYIANGVVLVPTFADEADLTALEIMQRLFPRRKVVALDCRDVIWGLGAIHCLTQQVPSGTPARGDSLD